MPNICLIGSPEENTENRDICIWGQRDWEFSELKFSIFKKDKFYKE